MKNWCRPDDVIHRRTDVDPISKSVVGPMMKQRRPDEVIRCRADVGPMSKTVIGPMKFSLIGPMKQPLARHLADKVVLVEYIHL